MAKTWSMVLGEIFAVIPNYEIYGDGGDSLSLGTKWWLSVGQPVRVSTLCALILFWDFGAI